mmetsp:Transcript_20013/g.40657  ORF Transcript_20013/g.40657 Transcript_20013/m.40657 type:complete len:254 (-) Transcript_20013:222-983(-)
MLLIGRLRLSAGLLDQAVGASCGLEYAVCGAAGLKLHQETGGGLHATGLKVWPSARVLAEHVIGQGVRGKRILELGAGTGAVGLACGIAGAYSVVLSDRLVLSGLATSRRQLQLLERNVSLNTPRLGDVLRVSVVELDFAAPADERSSASAALRQHGPFDFILGSDITYNRSAHPQLALCLLQLFDVRIGSAGGRRSRAPTVLLAQQVRQKDDMSCLIRTFQEAGLSTHVVHSVNSVDIFQVELAAAEALPAE